MRDSEPGPDYPTHDTLFDVYVRGDGQGERDEFAIGEAGADLYLIERVRGGEPKFRTLAFSKGIGRLADRVKNGFQKLPTRMYFNGRSNSFTVIHPDIDWKGGRWLLAAAPESIDDAARRIGERVAGLGPSIILPEEIEAWRHQQRRNAKHVVAFADHAAWPLVLAQMALENGWGLRSTSDLGACPDMPPTMAPDEWRSWLVPTFKPSQVQAIQAGLGWTVGDLVIADFAASPGGLSALL